MVLLHILLLLVPELFAPQNDLRYNVWATPSATSTVTPTRLARDNSNFNCLTWNVNRAMCFHPPWSTGADRSVYIHTNGITERIKSDSNLSEEDILSKLEGAQGWPPRGTRSPWNERSPVRKGSVQGGPPPNPKLPARCLPLAREVEYEIANFSLPGRSDLNDSLTIKIPLLKSTVHLKLRASPQVLDSNFIMLERYDNSTKLLTEMLKEDFHCFYGSHEGGIKGTFDLCDDGLHGVVSNGEELFNVKPLPLRFWKSRKYPRPHIIVRVSPNVAVHTGPRNPTAFRGIAYPGRTKRAVPINGEVRIETAVFVDLDLYRHMSNNFPFNTERQLLRFILAMVNAVQLLYHDTSLGYRVSFILKRLEILHTEPAGLQRPHDIDRYLSSFCLWQQQENPPADKSSLHWDHALMLTGLDLYVIAKSGKISNQVVGLAPVAGMCVPSSSCTVNEGRHFESVYVVAHEIGHNLGMRHDGPSADNNCDPGSHIMSPTLGSGKTTWSSCSKHYLQMFLQSSQAQCLFDSVGPQLDHSEGGVLPGERFDANVQCMLKYGKGSEHAPSQSLEDICRDLHCTRERYTWTSHPALEGTNCGPNKWCRRGRCIPKGLTEAIDQTTDGGWSDWTPFAECASGCLHGNHRLLIGSTGIAVASRRCNNPRPENGGRQCPGSDKRYQTCEAVQCGNIPPITIKEFAEQICRRAKDVDKDLVGSGFQRRSGDPEEACTVWCDQNNGGAKSRGWTFPDGTTCTLKKYSSKPTFCVSGRCEEFSCRTTNNTIFSASRQDCAAAFGQRIQFKATENPWISTGPCHFNCITPGKGLRVLKRGNEHNVQLCEPEKGCGRRKTLFEYASKICGRYKERVRKLSGLGIQLSPSLEDPDRPCHVACQDENVFHRFYLVTGEDGWFPFGTNCAREVSGRKAHCVSGKCLLFGDDDMPQFESKFIFPNIRRRRSLEFVNKTVIASIDSSAIHRVIEMLNQGLDPRYRFVRRQDVLSVGSIASLDHTGS